VATPRVNVQLLARRKDRKLGHQSKLRTAQARLGWEGL